ncbi:PREDICTED: uncharacterized protein LOC108780791 [Cyphomyrmex costatus]|uniref:uncharacterized protein LOC108780791 n=1 Tax=Cyphomyrmex costatus TaxID=456900 RepID=UPI0008523752|nr:PREDICTED: uncharacterized protein LOC108780791 [Cyphomyrmex costatus]
MSTQDENKKLKQRRATIKAQCTRAQSYIEGQDAQRATIIELRIRLQKLNSIWNEFDQVQARIEKLITEEAAVAEENDERINFEEKYYAVTTAFETLIQEIQLPMNQPLMQDVQVREGTPMTGTGLVNNNLKLPRVSMPTFSGKSEEWISFREVFDVISSLDASAENYREAWQMLKSRYNDPGLIVENHVKALFDLPTMSKDNHATLRRLLDTVLKRTRALKALRRCRALEAASRSSSTPDPSHKDKTAHDRSTTAHVTTTKNTCGFCRKENHAIYKCKDFLDLSVEQRMKEARSHKLCLNSLKAASHLAKECTARTCRKCSKRHNTLLHLEQASKNQSDSDAKKEKVDDSENTKSVTASNATVNQEHQVLLATALVNVLNSKGGVKSIRALLDNESQSCFITKDCCKQLGLHSQDTNILVCGIGKQSIQTRNIATVIIHSRTTGYKEELDCLIVDNITQDLPTNRISRNELQVPEGIVLADPQFNQPSRVDLLLGAEIFLDLLCSSRIKLADNQPTWQKTLLGWIVSGELTMMTNSKSRICNLSVNEQLNNSLMKFWQLEGYDKINTRTSEERACENHFAKTYKRNAEGRFIVTLPIKADILNNLGHSRDIATRRLYSLERRLKREPQRRIEYNRFMREYLKLGHMRKLQEPVNDEISYFYMLHHCVIKHSSTTTKLRIVFDASSKTTSGISLNNVLMIGSVLQQESLSILLRFRIYEYVLTGDLEKMYRQILINEEQAPLQKILWREDPSGANSKAEIVEIRDQLIHMVDKGSFKIRKWTSNNNEILQDLASSSKGQLLELDKEGSAKTLGINWNPTKDLFQYHILSDAPNPRLLGPIIITAKLMIQQLWKMQIDWDESLPMDLQAKWSHYIKELQILKELTTENHTSKQTELSRVVNALEINIDSKHYWTDSSIVLHWLQASNKKLPVFVAHRIGDIQETTSVESWKHVGSAENPAFDKDIKNLRSKGVVSSRSNLKQLNPFIDEENLIRVGGRLQRSHLQSDVKHPYLLHQRSHLTRLIVEHEHQRLMHAGMEATLAAAKVFGTDNEKSTYASSYTFKTIQLRKHRLLRINIRS